MKNFSGDGGAISRGIASGELKGKIGSARFGSISNFLKINSNSGVIFPSKLYAIALLKNHSYCLYHQRSDRSIYSPE
ncbi:hypothetical protein [Nostoc sp. CHAB 5715]|uniref:hypothetical protein n=1 Tax=Nostoc sp. CHAB 5715 TaxID=2780400 RepID=UPI001E305587|nr:hypothetical protein [Nostoc sp. CHAB 5715]MCC5621038.1 hypothetical protein [Nostoc sp. CHAB 5715]